MVSLAKGEPLGNRVGLGGGLAQWGHVGFEIWMGFSTLNILKAFEIWA